MKLLTSGGNGSGAEFINPFKSQFYTFFADGTFAGATVGLEISPDATGSRWFNTGIALTSAGAQNAEFRAERIRAVVTGGAGGVSINVDLL